MRWGEPSHHCYLCFRKAQPREEGRHVCLECHLYEGNGERCTEKATLWLHRAPQVQGHGSREMPQFGRVSVWHGLKEYTWEREGECVFVCVVMYVWGRLRVKHHNRELDFIFQAGGDIKNCLMRPTDEETAIWVPYKVGHFKPAGLSLALLSMNLLWTVYLFPTCCPGKGFRCFPF